MSSVPAGTRGSSPSPVSGGDAPSSPHLGRAKPGLQARGKRRCCRGGPGEGGCLPLCPGLGSPGKPTALQPRERAPCLPAVADRPIPRGCCCPVPWGYAWPCYPGRTGTIQREQQQCIFPAICWQIDLLLAVAGRFPSACYCQLWRNVSRNAVGCMGVCMSENHYDSEALRVNI